MAKNLLIQIFLIVFSTLILWAESQELVRKSDDFQQFHGKVERINLKDFGLDRQSRREIERQSPGVQREDDQRVKEGEDRRQNPLPRADPTLERRPDLGDRNHTYSGRGPYSGRPDFDRGSRRLFPGNTDSSTEREILSNWSPKPIDWSSSPRRIGAAYDSDLSSRRDFNFSLRSDSSIRGLTPRRERRNCSECVDSRYLQHYNARGCRLMPDIDCKCAVAFDCPSYSSENSTVCRYDGRIYQIGSRIPVRNPCRICECRDFGRRRGEILAEIDCGIGIECPEGAFGVKPKPNCYFAYEKDSCCGHQVCVNELQPKREQKVCKYKDREYKPGQKIYPDEDSCKICHCTEDWNDNNPLAAPACHTYRCEFELDKDFTTGCLPIYHEGTCCPIEYKCPKTFSLSSQPLDSTQCVFDGRKYPIGSKLVTDNVCVDCVCKVPPDFTCVHKSCPTPPTNCFVGKWDNSVCCQQYICSRPDHIRDESQFRANFYSPKNN